MKYVFLTPAIGWVGGAQIYCRNKIKFCQKKNYETFLFYDQKREIQITDLQSFEKIGLIEELAFYPQYYTIKFRKKIIEKILNRINFCEGEEVIFESHSPAESLWGELLARECKAKNFIFLLSETFQLSKSVMAFLEYKYQRNELACITKGVMKRLFEDYMPLSIDECYCLSAPCANAVEDIEIPSQLSKIGNHKVIGIIGRLQKEYVKVSVSEIAKFSRKHPNEKFQVLIIGGSNDKADILDIEYMLKPCLNLEIYITGNIYPIPRLLIKKMCVCLAAAGCAIAASQEGVPTISVDSYKKRAMGVVGYNTFSIIHCQRSDDIRSVAEYLELVLYTDFIKIHPYTPLPYDKENDDIDSAFQEHLNFLKKSCSKKEYYRNIEDSLTLKEAGKKIIIFIFGIKGFRWMTKIIARIKKK